MLTLADYQNHMRHAIGGDPDVRIDLAQTANEALSYLFNAHQWSWRGRPPTVLTAVVSQEYLDLPADFGEIIAVNRPNREVQLTSIQDLVHRRNLTLVPPPIASVFAALSYPAQTDQTAEAPNPRLEIFPTPTDTDIYTLSYRAGPILLTDPANVPNIPPEYERLFILLCRAFIRDYEEQDSTSEWAKIGTKESPGEMQRLMEHDGVQQANLGQLRGGAVDDPTLRVNFWVGGVTSRV